MSKHGESASSSSVLDLLSFQRQQTVFIVLNLLLLAVLLLMHWSLASYWGRPSRWLVATVGLVFLLRISEYLWVRRLSRPVSPAILHAVTWASIVLNVGLTILLSDLTDHEDSPYVALLFLPVLEAAFRFRLSTLLGVIVTSDFACFFWQWRFFVKHPPVDVGEYIEAGTFSLVLAIVGMLVWLLVRDLRRKERRLADNLLELERAREKLLHEEKLTAMGRLSSAIAHEIRNPVAMIASSIATANQLSGGEKEEMFGIAAEEAARLTQLTTEFLDYASARQPNVSVTSIADTVAYIADASRAHASQKALRFELDVPETLQASADPGQLQQALLNLVLNAVDASPAGGTITLRAHAERHRALIDVENSGSPIPQVTLERLFEPFFTTKPRGTGLGLAIARNIARAQGGDVTLTVNGPDSVRFSLSLPLPNGKSSR
ncbi:MAG: HAMP domain-containing sensor histidine kinase [Candidatus Sulfotelmatobacter sp.]